MQIAIVLGLLGVTIVLFATEKVPVDVITLIMLIALVMSGVLTVDQAFAGFSDSILVILASLFVISGALERSGVMDALGARLHMLARGGTNRLVFAVMALVSAVSAFANNTTATAVFLPPVLGVARKMNVSPSKVLMPLAYASILGGTCTLIGTSTNVAVSGYIARHGMRPIGLFELAPVGIVIVVVGIAYMLLIGRHLLPDHKPETLAEGYEIREYLSEVVVPEGSPLIGQRIFGSDLAAMGVRVLKVARDGTTFMPQPRTVIRAGDVYFVQGRSEDLVKIKAKAGIEIRPESKLSDLGAQGDAIRVVEMIVTPQSDLQGRNLQEANFRERYGLTVLAIYRHGHSLVDELSRVVLQTGDLLLVQGPTERLTYLRRHPDLWTLEELDPALYASPRSGLITAGVFGAALVLGFLGWVPLPIGILAAALWAVLSRAITMDEAYEFIDWRLLILIGGMTAFGIAMDQSGAASFLADGIVGALQPWGDRVVLAGFFALTLILTQPMSNAAAALVVLPIAIDAARSLGADERTFAIAIMLGASVSLITPFEPSCILVYGPGKYRFRDFVKVGFPLTFILMAVVLFLVPLLWPM
ncbi:MAG: SLC13 family permease [Ardenticatenales bacterium]|nr:SLC13 family permease [Ardenticatenales bacterium]